MKLSKRNDEKRILKAARGKGNRTYGGTLLGYQQIFQQKLQARKEWNGTFKVLKKIASQGILCGIVVLQI